MNNLGVVCFENLDALGRGWASINGEPAKKVVGIGELSNSVLWITNLPYKPFMRYNLNRNPNFFDHQFFRTSLKMIAEEVGLEDDIKLLSEFCSGIFSKILKKTSEAYKIDLKNPDYRLSNMLADYLIPRPIRQIPMGSYSSELQEAFKEATQQNQGFLGEIPAKSKARSFVFPRNAYAKEILSKPYPASSHWVRFEPSEICTEIGLFKGNVISGTKAAINKINKLCKNKAAIFKVSITETDKFFGSFATFSQGSNHRRNWVALPELINIIQYSKVRIIDGFYSDCEQLKISEHIDLNSNEFALSTGLFLENIWVGYSLAPNKSSNFTSLSAYIRAYDRVMCQKAAFEFARNNFTVGSYGTGRVVVYCNKAQEKMAKEIALENGLIPPMCLLGE